MAITKKDVEHAAMLARLELSEDEKVTYTSQLDSILKYVENLRSVSTDGIEPTAHVVPVKISLREDNVKESLVQDEALANAPEKANGCFKVSRTIE